jgi:hypothetical protein
MPLRTINDAVFRFRQKDDSFHSALRGQQVDIPEGDDLERGDKFGAFTKDNTEPAPPEGSILPDIEVDWDDAEYARFIDAATADEITDKLNAIDADQRALVATKLLEAENGRNPARKGVLTSLQKVIAGAPSQTAPTE